ncbi:Trafficking protein particle complex subunit 2-like protein [Drosera capensis]
MIVCVAVVGHQNNPLYIQSFTESHDALKLHHIVHCSLDVVDERVNNPKKSGPLLNETFLGLLYPTENYKVYGYLTNTKVKFILVTTDLDVRDADVRSFFKKFHAAYVDAVSNPFHVPGKKITSRTFAERVSAIVKYGYLTNTKVKFILVTTDLDVRDADVRSFFKKFHAAYVDAVSNPFHVPGKKITSRTFAERVSAIVKSFGLVE